MNIAAQTQARQGGGDDWSPAAIMVCHELRNALGPLLNAAELLNLPDTDLENGQWARQTLLRQARLMKRLLSDMLDPRSPETGLFQLNAKVLDLGQLIGTVCGDHQGLFQAHGIELKVDTPPTHILVAGDAVRLTQVVTNLVQNALKYTTRGGQVTVRLWVDQNADAALISVRDTGVGMLPEVLADVLAGRPVLRRLRGGQGIGLPLRRQIIEQHGGDFLIHSDGPGKGSEFVARFPLADMGTSGRA